MYFGSGVCPQNVNFAHFYLTFFNRIYIYLHFENDINTGIYDEPSARFLLPVTMPKTGR